MPQPPRKVNPYVSSSDKSHRRDKERKDKELKTKNNNIKITKTKLTLTNVGKVNIIKKIYGTCYCVQLNLPLFSQTVSLIPLHFVLMNLFEPQMVQGMH